MCRLRNIAMRDYKESVTTGQTDGHTDAGQSDPYVSLCFAGDTKIGPLYLIAVCAAMLCNWDPRVEKIVAAFAGMNVLPVKHSYA